MINGWPGRAEFAFHQAVEQVGMAHGKVLPVPEIHCIGIEFFSKKPQFFPDSFYRWS